MNRIALFLSFLFPFLLSAQPVEMRIHPSQIGLFGAGNGDFLRANPASGGGEWSPTASLQGSLFLPSGTTGQTLRHNGTGWEANSVLYNSGTNVGIGTSSPGAKLHVAGSCIIEGPTIHSVAASTRMYHGVASKYFGDTYTGLMVIKLPLRWSNTFLSIRIKGFNYSTYSNWEVVVSGYNFSGGFWANQTSEIYGRPPFSIVRMADDGVNNAIVLGNTNTVWSTPTINVTEVLASGISTGWETGWSIGVESSESPYTFWSTTNAKVLYDDNSIRIVPDNNYLYSTVIETKATEANALSIKTYGDNDILVVKDQGLNQARTVLNNYYGVGLSCGFSYVNSSTLGNVKLWATPGGIGIGTPSPSAALHIASGDIKNSQWTTPGNVITNTGTGVFESVSPASVVSNGGGLTTSTTFSGDVTGLYNNTQIAANAVTSAEIANSTITGFDIAAATITSTNLNTTGVASGTYGSATQAPVITVGTDGRIISASNATISGTNIYTTDGSLTGNRIVTIGANSLTMKNTTTGTGHKLLILSDYMGGSNNPKFLSFTDEIDVERGYISNNTNTGVNIYGQYGIDMQSGGNILFRPNGKTFGFYGTGYISFENIASDPGSTGDGALWYNYVAGRMKYTANSTTHSIASLETDIIGDAPAANSSSFTLPAQQFYTVADANGGSFTITFDATMREGIDYVIECRRNGTNTITFDAGSGYNLAVDTFSSFPDDGAVAMGGGGSGIQAAHKVYYVRRHGSSISVK